jgi:hypothetical protein
MKSYNVKMTETIIKYLNVSVNAESSEQAEQVIFDLWADGEFDSIMIDDGEGNFKMDTTQIPSLEDLKQYIKDRENEQKL